MAKLEYHDTGSGTFRVATGSGGKIDVNATSTLDTSTNIGVNSDAPASTDTGTFSLISLTKRALQNWTTLLGKVPAKGVAASAASVPVVLASDDAQVGAKVTAVTALGAGGSGLIGWLSTIANFVKGLPTALGVAVSAASLPVVLASDDAQIGVKVTAVTALGTGGTGIIGWLSNLWGSAFGTANASTDAGNPVKVGGVFNTTPTTLTTGQRGDLQMDAIGNTRVALYASGLNTAIGAAADNADAVAVSTFASRLITLARQTLFNGTTWDRDTKATNTARILSAAATTNATSVKASAGTLHAIDLYNAAATVKYLKLYNKASAPTVGTDTPVRTLALKPTDKTQITFPKGLYFATGIALALTGAAADADTTALAAADVVGLNVDYS